MERVKGHLRHASPHQARLYAAVARIKPKHVTLAAAAIAIIVTVYSLHELHHLVDANDTTMGLPVHTDLKTLAGKALVHVESLPHLGANRGTFLHIGEEGLAGHPGEGVIGGHAGTGRCARRGCCRMRPQWRSACTPLPRAPLRAMAWNTNAVDAGNARR